MANPSRVPSSGTTAPLLLGAVFTEPAFRVGVGLAGEDEWDAPLRSMRLLASDDPRIFQLCFQVPPAGGAWEIRLPLRAYPQTAQRPKSRNRIVPAYQSTRRGQ